LISFYSFVGEVTKQNGGEDCKTTSSILFEKASIFLIKPFDRMGKKFTMHLKQEMRAERKKSLPLLIKSCGLQKGAWRS
jgi:hypothetical protein